MKPNDESNLTDDQVRNIIEKIKDEHRQKIGEINSSESGLLVSEETPEDKIKNFLNKHRISLICVAVFGFTWILQFDVIKGAFQGFLAVLAIGIILILAIGFIFGVLPYVLIIFGAVMIFSKLETGLLMIIAGCLLLLLSKKNNQ
jgi:hypothetical protein